VGSEAAETYRAFGLPGSTGRRRESESSKDRAALLAFTLNEMSDPAREALLARLVERGSHSDQRADRRTDGRLRRAMVESLARSGRGRGVSR
jgi:hypothetical protein